MSTLTFPHAAGGHGHAAFGWAVKTLKTFAAFVHRERDVRACIHQLQALGDRELADMGLTRGDIETAVRGRKR